MGCHLGLGALPSAGVTAVPSLLLSRGWAL